MFDETILVAFQTILTGFESHPAEIQSKYIENSANGVYHGWATIIFHW